MSMFELHRVVLRCPNVIPLSFFDIPFTLFDLPLIIFKFPSMRLRFSVVIAFDSVDVAIVIVFL